MTTRWALLLLLCVAMLLGLALFRRGRPPSPEQFFHAGVTAFASGDVDSVQTAAEALQGLAGYEPHAHVLEGMFLLRRDRLLEAIEQFGHGKDHPDTQVLAYALSGEALYKARLFRDAERILHTAVQLDPAQTEARRWLAALYFDLGAMNHALRHLEVVSREAPSDPRPPKMRATIFKDFEKHAEAVAEYRESLRRDPQQPDKHVILLGIAECLVKLQRSAEAMEALADCPESAAALALQARCHYAQGDRAAARKLVDQALRLAPGHLEARQLRATLALDGGDLAAALADLRQAVEDHPNDYRLRYRLAQVYQRLGQEPLAREQSEASKRLRELWTQFSKLHDQAMEQPTDVEVRYQLGLVATRLDKPDVASDWFSVVLALDPQHAGARRALRELVRGSGRDVISPRGPRPDSAE